MTTYSDPPGDVYDLGQYDAWFEPNTFLDGLTAAMDSGVFDLTPGEVATVEANIQESSKS